MGIAVPSQLRKATQQWNPSPPLPLLPPPPLPPRLAMASASTTPTPLPASSSRSEAPPSQTPQPLSRLPPLTTWQPRLSTADMADTDTVVMEATESALLRLGSLITSLKFPSVWSLHSRGCSSRYIRSCRSMLHPRVPSRRSCSPAKGPLHIVPEWYFLCQYAMLKAVPNKNAGFIVLLTSIFALFFFGEIRNLTTFCLLNNNSFSLSFFL